MNLYLIRHAIALDRDEALHLGIADADRGLTEKGIKRFKQVASRLPTILENIDCIITSPWLRADQTAQILHKYYPDSELKRDARLVSGNTTQQLIDLIEDHASLTNLVLIGHDPDFSELASFLLSSESAIALNLKKGSVCSLTIDTPVRSGNAVLQYLIQPGHFRGIAQV